MKTKKFFPIITITILLLFCFNTISTDYVDIPNPGHGGDDIVVKIGNTQKTLQEFFSSFGPYFISSSGSNGQVWTSDGSGKGHWKTINTGNNIDTCSAGYSIRAISNSGSVTCEKDDDTIKSVRIKTLSNKACKHGTWPPDNYPNCGDREIERWYENKASSYCGSGCWSCDYCREFFVKCVELY